MEKQRKIIIATHGELAKGLLSAVRIIVGETAKIETICGYLEADFDLEQTIISVMENHNFDTDELIVCTDMMGGSINNGFVKYLKQYPFHLITNINLAFLVDLLLSNTIDVETLSQKVQEDLVAVKYVNSLVNTFEECLDDAI